MNRTVLYAVGAVVVAYFAWQWWKKRQLDQAIASAQVPAFANF